jgi:predicted RNA-binding protein YlqC (UPF0109 family)
MEQFEQLIQQLFLPRVMHAELVQVTTVNEEEGFITYQVFVHPDDLGRVIGKGGRVANAVRTIAYAGAAKEGKRIRIDIDAHPTNE